MASPWMIRRAISFRRAGVTMPRRRPSLAFSRVNKRSQRQRVVRSRPSASSNRTSFALGSRSLAGRMVRQLKTTTSGFASMRGWLETSTHGCSPKRSSGVDFSCFQSASECLSAGRRIASVGIRSSFFILQRIRGSGRDLSVEFRAARIQDDWPTGLGFGRAPGRRRRMRLRPGCAWRVGGRSGFMHA